MEEQWPKKLDAAIKRKFGVKTETFFDLIGSMRYVTRAAGGKNLPKKVHAFIEAWMNKNVPA